MKNNDNFVSVPAMTLNALKQYLFASESGVDLSSIVEDLGGGDLTAINVGLVFKGVKPEVDTKPRYDGNYGKRYYRYDFKSYSLINDIVFCERTSLKYNPETGDSHVDYPATPVKLTYGEWMNMTTDVQDIINKFLADENK